MGYNLYGTRIQQKLLPMVCGLYYNSQANEAPQKFYTCSIKDSGVGQDHILLSIFLLNVVLLPGTSSKSHSNGCIVMITITTVIKLKVVTVTHCHHCKANNFVTVAFLLL